MRILHYVDAAFIGWEVPYIELIKSLDSLGIENILLCRPKGRIEKVAREYNVKLFTYKHLFSWSPIVSPRFMKLIKEISPDIIHTRLSNAARIAGLCGKKLNIPVVSTLDGCFNLKCYKNSTHLLPCSKAVRDYEISCGVPLEKMTTIHNAINLQKFSPNEQKRNEFRKNFGVSNNDLIFLGLGSYTYRKGFDILLKAFAEFLKKSTFKNAYLWLAGNGEEQENLVRLANELNISERVSFLGYVEDVRQVLWVSDILVMPSRAEEFSLALLEGIASGLPVIVSDIEPFTEIISEEQNNGFVAEGENPESFAMKMLKMLKIGDKERKIIANNALEMVKKNFTTEIIAKKTLKIYENFTLR